MLRTHNITKAYQIMTDYKEYDCETAYNEIIKRLGSRGIPDDYRRGLESLKDAGGDYLVHMGTIDISDISNDVIKQVIGKGGCYFIMTTSEQDLDFIWHNVEKKEFEFWGPKDNIVNGINEINYRITKIRSTIEMDDDYEKFKYVDIDDDAGGNDAGGDGDL